MSDSLSQIRQDSKSYEWLPFRFDRLRHGGVAVTNMIGEWLKLSESEFDDLSNQEFSKPEFVKKLTSKHIIRVKNDELPLRLLALKFATKNKDLGYATGLHIFVVTLRCEHACEYCQVSRQNSKNTEFDMSESDAFAALEIAFMSPSKNIKLEFQGGESLLNFDLIKKIVLRAQEMNIEYAKNLAFVIATNLAVIDDEILAFSKTHNIFFSTSLDGPGSLHNANRARPGRNSWELAVSGIEKVRRELGHDQVSALMTTTDRSLTMSKEIVDEYVRMGFQEIFLRHLSPYGHAVKSGANLRYDGRRWLNFYFEGLEYIIELNRNGTEIVEILASTYLKKMLTNSSGGYVDLATPTGAGLGALVYNYDGDIYASDEGRMLKEMGDETFKLGSVRTHTFRDVLLSENLLNAVEESFAPSNPMCSDCAFETHCGSDPVVHHATQGDFVGFKPLSTFCERTTEIVPFLMEKYETDRFCRDLFTRWSVR